MDTYIDVGKIRVGKMEINTEDNVVTRLRMFILRLGHLSDL